MRLSTYQLNRTMKIEDKYWEVVCYRHLKEIYKTSINTKHISEKGLKTFIETLMAKYALSDDEIVEQYLRIPFKKPKKYIHISRTSEFIHEQLHITFMTQIADISILANLKTKKDLT